MTTVPDWKSFETEVTKQPGTVLVDFYTDTCPPCRMMSPVLDELAKERTDVKIVKVNAAENTEASVNFRISAVPTFMLFSNGQLRGQFTGARSKKDLAAWIDAKR